METRAQERQSLICKRWASWAMRSIKVTSSAFPGERAPSRHCLGKGGWGGGGSRRWAVGTRVTAGAPGNEKGSSTYMRQTPNLLALREPKTEDAQARTKGGEKTRALHTNTHTAYTPHPVLACAHTNTRSMDVSHTRAHSFTPTTHPAWTHCSYGTHTQASCVSCCHLFSIFHLLWEITTV